MVRLDQQEITCKLLSMPDTAYAIRPHRILMSTKDTAGRPGRGVVGRGDTRHKERAMKAKLFVMGQYRGEIEVGENSIMGALARGAMGQAMRGVNALQEDLNRICSESGEDEQAGGDRHNRVSALAEKGDESEGKQANRATAPSANDS